MRCGAVEYDSGRGLRGAETSSGEEPGMGEVDSRQGRRWLMNCFLFFSFSFSFC
jgi:hypothetical protein